MVVSFRQDVQKAEQDGKTKITRASLLKNGLLMVINRGGERASGSVEIDCQIVGNV